MTKLVIPVANPTPSASPEQGASQAQGSNKPEVVTAEQALDPDKAVTSEQVATPEIVQASIWYLYLVRCTNGHLYTGITTDVARRFSEHQSGGAKAAKFLRGKGPLTLMYQEVVGSHGDALRREIAVKKLSRAKKFALIKDADSVSM